MAMVDGYFDLLAHCVTCIASRHLQPVPARSALPAAVFARSHFGGLRSGWETWSVWDAE